MSDEYGEFIRSMESFASLDISKKTGWDGDGDRVIQNLNISSPPLHGERRSSTGSRVDKRMMKMDSSRPVSSISGTSLSEDSTSRGQNSFVVENITLKAADETRIEDAIINAERKQTSGSVFSIRINMQRSGGVLGIGIKDMNQGILVISMLKRKNNVPGPGEQAGLRLGDVIFGINYEPVRFGSRSLLKTIKAITRNFREGANSDPNEFPREFKYLHIQCWRCHQLCSDPIPGAQFPRTDDVVVKAYALYRTQIFSDWERWNFLEIIMSHMLVDNCERVRRQAVEDSTPQDRKHGHRLSIDRRELSLQISVLDMEHNISLAKCLRKALCVRIVHTKPTHSNDTVAYVLRIEDVETGLQWVVHRRYRDFYTLNEELQEMSGYCQDIQFPQKRFQRNSTKLIESRIVALEEYLRRTMYNLNIHATTDPTASRSLRYVQKFLGVDKFIDCMYPPTVDDQRFIELLAFQFLNDFGSPACQQCMRFVHNVDLDALVDHDKEDGYIPALQHLSQALTEVEHFTLQQHQHQMHIELKERRPEMSNDQISTFVRRCVRRQVEAAIFLPLRRTIFRIVFSFMAPRTQQMHDSLALLVGASTDFFLVNSAAPKAKALTKAVRKFRDVTRAYLPADQSQLLMHAASAVMEMHVECMNIQQQQRQQTEMKQEQETNKLLSNVMLGSSHSDPMDSGHIVESASDSSSEILTDDGEDEDCDDDAGTERKTHGAWERSHGPQQFDQSFEDASPSQPSDNMPLLRQASADDNMLLRNKNSSPVPRHTDTDSVGGDHNIDEQMRSRRWSVGSTSVSRKARHEALFKETAGDGISVDSSIDTEKSPQPPNASEVEKNEGVFASRSPVDVRQPPRPPPVKEDQSEALSPQSDMATNTAMAVGNRSRTTSWASYGGSGSKKRIDFVSPAVYADPIKELFESRETVPAAELHRDKQRSRAITDGASAPPDLTMLSEYDSEEELPLESLEEQHKSERSQSSPVTPLEKSKGRGRGKSFFSPNINMNPPTNLGPAQISPSSILTYKKGTEGDDSVSSSTVQEPVGPVNIVGSINNKNKAIIADIALNKTASVKPSPGNASEPAAKEGNIVDGSIFRESFLNEVTNTSGFYEAQAQAQSNAVSADDFLPMFTYVLVQTNLPHLLIAKEMMTSLVDDEETYGECGYYLATLEAALRHITDLAVDFKNSSFSGAEGNGSRSRRASSSSKN